MTNICFVAWKPNRESTKEKRDEDEFRWSMVCSSQRAKVHHLDFTMERSEICVQKARGHSRLLRFEGPEKELGFPFGVSFKTTQGRCQVRQKGEPRWASPASPPPAPGAPGAAPRPVPAGDLRGSIAVTGGPQIFECFPFWWLFLSVTQNGAHFKVKRKVFLATLSLRIYMFVPGNPIQRAIWGRSVVEGTFEKDFVVPFRLSFKTTQQRGYQLQTKASLPRHKDQSGVGLKESWVPKAIRTLFQTSGFPGASWLLPIRWLERRPKPRNCHLCCPVSQASWVGSHDL